MTRPINHQELLVTKVSITSQSKKPKI